MRKLIDIKEEEVQPLKLKIMTSYTTKELALENSELINREKGYRISFVTYVGKTIADMYSLNSNGWYVQNKETKSFY